MNDLQRILARMFLITIIGLVSSVIIVTNKANAQTMESYKVIDVKREVADGKEKEVAMLFEGERRKIVQLTLRNGKRLESHSVEEPILIQCISGGGDLLIQNEDAEETIEIIPGKIITIEGGVLHDVIAKPEISIILIRFLDSENEIKK